MHIKIGKIELEDWVQNHHFSHPVRYSVNYQELLEGCVFLHRKFQLDQVYGDYMWEPFFCHDLFFLSKIFTDTQGSYISGSQEEAMAKIDHFLIRINNKLLPFL